MVNSIGLEASKSGFTFVVISADPSRLVEAATRSFPPNLGRADALDWVYRELNELFARHVPQVGTLKHAESAGASSKSILEHAQVDGVLLACSARANLPMTSLATVTLARKLNCANKGEMEAKLAALCDEYSVPKVRAKALGCAVAGLEGL